MNKDFLKDLAHQAGCAEDTIQKIDTITLARELWQLLPAEEQETFFNLLLKDAMNIAPHSCLKENYLSY